MTYRIKTLLLVTAGIASVLAATLYLRSTDWTYSLITSIDCGANRTINIYEDAFCDYATIPVYDIESNGQKSASKFSTGLWHECGDRLDLSLFSHRIDDTGDLIAIIYDGDVVAIYDFETSSNIELPSSGDILDIPQAIRERLKLAATPTPDAG